MTLTQIIGSTITLINHLYEDLYPLPIEDIWKIRVIFVIDLSWDDTILDLENFI